MSAPSIVDHAINDVRVTVPTIFDADTRSLAAVAAAASGSPRLSCNPNA